MFDNPWQFIFGGEFLILSLSFVFLSFFSFGLILGERGEGEWNRWADPHLFLLWEYSPFSSLVNALSTTLQGSGWDFSKDHI